MDTVQYLSCTALRSGAIHRSTFGASIAGISLWSTIRPGIEVPLATTNESVTSGTAVAQASLGQALRNHYMCPCKARDRESDISNNPKSRFLGSCRRSTCRSTICPRVRQQSYVLDYFLPPRSIGQHMSRPNALHPHSARRPRSNARYDDHSTKAPQREYRKTLSKYGHRPALLLYNFTFRYGSPFMDHRRAVKQPTSPRMSPMATGFASSGSSERGRRATTPLMPCLVLHVAGSLST